MDSDLSPTLPTPTSVFGGSATSGSQRKERGAIAAQACDTCRSRKQKCDEKRPKCSTCQRFNLECNYREPQPTKKDKTLAEILDRIKSLENKIDSLGVRASFSATSQETDLQNEGPSTAPSSVTPGLGSSFGTSIFLPSTSASSASTTVPATEDQYKYVSSVHEMLSWPAVQQVLESARPQTGLDLSTIARDGPAMVLGLHDQSRRLPASNTGSLNFPGQGPDVSSFTIQSLTWDTMQRLSKAYFNTFNLMYPILDQQSFVSSTMSLVFSEGFSEGMASTIALLIYALGEVAISGTQGIPIHVSNGRPSGVKGGTATQPPGLNLFNEARKRMGFNLTECSLENVQIFALAGLYYGTCCHHMEFWRMTASASLACQALITSNPSELSSPRADLLRRIFWHCSIMETTINLELGLPLTGLQKLEHIVGLPDFSGPFSHEEYAGNESSHFQEYFASQIVLRRLLVDFHNVLSQPPTSSPGSDPSFLPLTPSQPTALNGATINQLASQLEQWHDMLPAALKWQEDYPASFPNPAQDAYSSASTSASSAPAPLMFTTDLDAPPSSYPYVLDIQVAILRTRYYYAKYLIHRPFLYKALHYPDAMTTSDAAGAATCLRAALRWPITMSPACARKRLVPCGIFWTQNTLGVLVVLHLSLGVPGVPALRQIRAALCGERFEIEARETVGLCIDWVRDLKAVDGAAGWAWEVVRGLYGLEE